ncbi:MAG TPA: peptidoglycan editing factor PgeF [Streptosporangiaceae bacterium]|nr:peptidoglycan editing factor PgeF [Streptosporangiaceae bacterium]
MAALPTATAGLRERAGLEVLAWPAFDPFPVDVMVTTRHGGVSTGPYASLNLGYHVNDDPANVTENRRRAATALKADLADFVFARQVHGRNAQVVTRADRSRGALDPADAIGDADALVTADPGTVLAVVVADCMPIVLYDPQAHVLACAHAGWRGTLAGVAEAALSAMCALGSRPADVLAGLGPAISAETYQVGPDVAEAAERALGHRAAAALRESGPGSWLFDIEAANRAVLTAAGVAPENIHPAGFTTGPGDGLFFSHRAQQPCGRFAAVARLLPRSAT